MEITTGLIVVMAFQGITALIVSIVGWWVRDNSKQLREMNGNVRDLKAWKDVHQPEEERWQRENRQDHKEMWEEISTIRKDK